MKRYIYILLIAAFVSGSGVAFAQSRPADNNGESQVQQRPGAGFSLAEYGVEVQPDSRLIVMMAALEVAGFDPTPPGQEPSAFRAQVRRDLANTDPDLRQRLRNFYERNKRP